MKQVFQRTIVDENGDVVPNAELEIRYESNGQLALTWTDRAGETTGSNPVQADEDGFVQIYLDPGRYKMTPSSSGQGVGDPWRDVLILSENLVSFDALYSAESTTLFREPPVTTGTSSAYTVDGWSGLTFANDTVYYAKAHTANTGACTIDSLSIVNLDSSALSAGQIQQNHVMKLLYQSSGTKFLLLNPSPKVIPSVDINGGTIDDTTIGTTSGNLMLDPANGICTVLGPSTGNTNISYFRFAQSDNTRDGFIGVSQNTNRNLQINADAGDIELVASGSVRVGFGGATVSTNSTSSTHTVQQIELGHASDTTLTRASAGQLAVEGVTVATASNTLTLSGKSIAFGSNTLSGTMAQFDTACSDGNFVYESDIGSFVQAQSSTLQDLADNLTSTASEIDAAVAASGSPPSVSGYVAATATYVHEDGGNTTSFDVDSGITEDTFESIGPTDSGADNIWTALDDLPSSAKIATIAIQILSPTSNLDSTGNVTVYCRKTGSSATIGGPTSVARLAYVYDDNAAGSYGLLEIVDVPLDSSRRFDMAWAETGLTGSSILMYLKGFKV